MSTTHVAGLPVNVHGTHVRQRCAWCGTILIDQDLTRIAVAIDPANPDASTSLAMWEVGGFVRVDEGNPRVLSLVEDDSEDDEPSKMPDDACAKLPPDLTDGSIR